jgi:hypothetical protein
MSVSCRDYTTELVCYNDGTTSKQLIAHYEYAKGRNNSILLATRYTEADGVTVVDTTTGTVTAGECCKKEIFATHQRYYVTSGIGIPSNYVAYWLGEIMETWLGQVGADTSNCFIHATHGILNGVADGGVGTDLISPFTGTTPGIPLTNVSLVQSMTNISAANMGLASTDLIYAITNDNQPVWFLSPAAIALLPNNTYLHPYMYFTDTPGTYNECDINIAAPYTIADVQQTSAQGGEITCTPIQEIKEKDGCTGEETYRYVTEDGTGQLLDASIVITNFDEANVKTECPTVVTPTIEYIPHVSGCIKRKNGTVEVTCKSTNTTYNFSDTDTVGFTITANDGNGNYTIIQEQSNTIAHNKFLTLLQNVSQPNARILEDVGPGFTTFHIWTGNVTNVISISPTEVQFDFHVEAGVSDTPTPLISPCVDPVPDATYQADAVTLRSIYDPVPLNVQQPNGATALILTVTNYSLEYNITGGTEDFIPAKQIVYKDIDGSFVEEYRTVGDINTLIPFNPITDTFSVNCEQTATTTSGTIYEKEVCGTVNGSTDNYELIKVYTRDATGNITVLHYEDKFGNVVSGTVVEVCCTCDSLCVLPSASKVCFGYSTLFNGFDTMGDRVVSGAQFFIQYLEVDGSVVINAPTLIGTTTGGLTLTDVGYGLAYNKIVDLLNTNVAIQNASVTFVPASGASVPNPARDPMCWGVEYDDTKDVRMVLSDFIPVGSTVHEWSIRLSSTPGETFDCIGDARVAPSWSFADVSATWNALNLSNCQTL